MAGQEHLYSVTNEWTGNLGEGTANPRAYSRDHLLKGEGKIDIPGSADPAFRGDASRWNPEELLVGALSACHKLVYLHLCAMKGITVVSYEDHAEGTMTQSGVSGQFTNVTLKPVVTIAAGDDADLAMKLHHDAPAMCFIAQSVNFPVEHEPVIKVAV